ncbi:MAG: acyl-CoA thioesterase [Deltaproteobacteria bacterium]|nr:acyl-CoA thioesterase [Deltaproteobacteria bacterium]
MNLYTLVRPEHLNHHGYLFGGMLLKWVDEFAWLTASREYRGCRLVTVGMDEVRFTQSVSSGAMLRFQVNRLHQGRTAVTYGVEVFADEDGAVDERPVFNTRITFVRVDRQGQKIPLPECGPGKDCSTNTWV